MTFGEAFQLTVHSIAMVWVLSVYWTYVPVYGHVLPSDWWHLVKLFNLPIPCKNQWFVVGQICISFLTYISHMSIHSINQVPVLFSSATIKRNKSVQGKYESQILTQVKYNKFPTIQVWESRLHSSAFFPLCTLNNLITSNNL